ncbi:MAG: hypothetical protein IPL29_02285 [Propionivibrio sp.]|nr:hypothetical protein [Propionivibrio sp.]
MKVCGLSRRHRWPALGSPGVGGVTGVRQPQPMGAAAGKPDYFYGTVWAGRDRVKTAVEEAMKDAADSLKGRS